MTGESILDNHVSSKRTTSMWEVQPVDGKLNQIFNTDESGDEEGGILSDFTIPSPLRDDALYESRLNSPLGLGDPLTSLTLPSFSAYTTPQHEFGRQFSLTQESPSEFDKFVTGLDGDTNSSIPNLLSPPHGDLDDMDLRDLISKSPASPISGTPLNIENLLEIDPRSSQEQLQDIINIATATDSPKSSLTEVPPSPHPKSSIKPGTPLPKTTLNKPNKRAPPGSLSSDNLSQIVDRLDNLIAGNENTIKHNRNVSTKEHHGTQLSKSRNTRRGLAMQQSRPVKKQNIKPRPPTKPAAAPPPAPPPAQHPPVSTSDTLESLATSLGIIKPGSRVAASPPRVQNVVNSHHKRNIVKVQTNVRKPIVVGKAPPIQTNKTVITPTNPSAAANKQLIVPYKTPATKPAPSTAAKKYVLLPLEKLQNASPALISQLGLDSSLLGNNKRPAAAIQSTEPATSDKRLKPDQTGTSFTEKTKFPINITLPSSAKEKIKEFPGTIPELMEKARAKRKAHLSNMSTFTQMESFINDFIQQNNDQVMEILFLKQNNKEINKRYNQLAKLFHIKNEEHQQLKKEVKDLSVSNRKIERELKAIKDLIKKSMMSDG